VHSLKCPSSMHLKHLPSISGEISRRTGGAGPRGSFPLSSWRRRHCSFLEGGGLSHGAAGHRPDSSTRGPEEAAPSANAAEGRAADAAEVSDSDERPRPETMGLSPTSLLPPDKAADDWGLEAMARHTTVGAGAEVTAGEESGCRYRGSSRREAVDAGTGVVHGGGTGTLGERLPTVSNSASQLNCVQMISSCSTPWSERSS
jgi:hypothetical protein